MQTRHPPALGDASVPTPPSTAPAPTRTTNVTWLSMGSRKKPTRVSRPGNYDLGRDTLVLFHHSEREMGCSWCLQRSYVFQVDRL